MTETTDVCQVPKMLIDYFQTMPTVPDTNFIVAGYHVEDHVKLSVCTI